jgi:hypothetical protein
LQKSSGLALSPLPLAGEGIKGVRVRRRDVRTPSHIVEADVIDRANRPIMAAEE